jgi:hypothetical protein
MEMEILFCSVYWGHYRNKSSVGNFLAVGNIQLYGMYATGDG